MTKLGDNLSRYHIIVDDIYFASIRFSPEYEGAIEAKQVAQQQVETQKQVLAQREIEAQQKVATAKGEAESILVVAQGQAKANDALSRSISPILVQYKGIEKWNGILPQVSGGTVPLIDLGKMGGFSSGTEGSRNKLRVQNLHYSPERKYRDKTGDMFKDIKSGKMFIAKGVDPRVIILGTKDGTHSIFVNPSDIESMFLPFVEDKAKRNLK